MKIPKVIRSIFNFNKFGNSISLPDSNQQKLTNTRFTCNLATDKSIDLEKIKQQILLNPWVSSSYPPKLLINSEEDELYIELLILENNKKSDVIEAIKLLLKDVII